MRAEEGRRRVGAVAARALFVGAAVAGLSWLGCSEERPEPAPPPAPVRVAVHSAPLSADPHLHNEFATFSVHSNVVEGLTRFDAHARIEPALATRWSNPDDLTWRFEIRSDVRFHDGSLLRAEDVVASLLRVRDPARSGFASYLVEVEDVRVDGPSIVEIRTTRPFPILLNKLAFASILPADLEEPVTEPVGTGPYRWAGREGDVLRLEAFPDYWAGSPAVPGLEMVVLPEAEERARALVEGRIDLSTRLSPAAAATLETAACCRVEGRPSLVVEYLAVRPSVAPYDDPRVRRALHLAIGRREIAEESYRGRAVPLGQMVPPDVFGHHPGLVAPHRDLEAARGLLEDAGHPDGFEMTLEYRPGRRAEVVVRHLEEAGIRVEVRERPWAEVYDRLLAGEVDAYLGGLLAVSSDASDLLDSTIHSAEPERGYGVNNSMGYRNPAVDRAIEDSGATMDMLARRDLLQHAMELLMEDLVFLPVVSPHDLYGVRRGLEWTPRADGMVRGVEIAASSSLRSD